eukprot:gene6749-7459_t
MNRANQLALFQATNQGLLQIRQLELNYYINLNIAFGTQAALIGGFTYGIFTQNQFRDDNSYSETFQKIYWVTSAGTIAASVHVIITTMLLQVLGPGLALHGPVGSVANACQGMRREQKTIFTAFIVMMVLFSITTTLSFWAVMAFESAVGSTVMFVLAARYWWVYSERIYLRFYWDPKEEGYQASEGPDRDSYSPPPPLEPELVSDNPIHEKHGVDRVQSSISEFNQSVSPDDVLTERDEETDKAKAKGFKVFIPKAFRRTSEKKIASPSSKDDPTRQTSSASVTTSGLPGELSYGAAVVVVVMEGYLTKRGKESGSGNRLVDLKSEPWQRLYATLTSVGRLAFYENRQCYRNQPKLPVFKRPLLLSDYWIEFKNAEQERTISMETSTTLSTVVGPDGRKVPKFQITLLPKDNEEGESIRYPWILRCDTEEELEVWVTAMNEVSPQSFRVALG